MVQTVIVSVLEYDGPNDYGPKELTTMPRIGESIELSKEVFRVRDVRILEYGQLELTGQWGTGFVSAILFVEKL